MSETFGELPDGQAVRIFSIGEPNGPTARILTYGARIASLSVPVGGVAREITLHHKTLEGYVSDIAYLGAVVGRFANRIRGGRFAIDDEPVSVTVNNGPHMLHGGTTGFDRAVWLADPDGDALVLRHISPAGDQGFPGRLEVTVRYAIEGDALAIDYMATTDAPTVLNLSNHAYFNLDGCDGAAQGDILDHELTLHAERFTPVDAGLVPTGEWREVANTPFDFRAPRRIGARIDAEDEQLGRGHGYDHNFCLADAPLTQPRRAARVSAGGLTMDVLTTEPGIQFYSGNFLPQAGWKLRSALCLETQHFPDSPNQPSFPSTLLRPDGTFRSRTLYQFTGGPLTAD